MRLLLFVLQKTTTKADEIMTNSLKKPIQAGKLQNGLPVEM